MARVVSPCRGSPDSRQNLHGIPSTVRKAVSKSPNCVRLAKGREVRFAAPCAAPGAKWEPRVAAKSAWHPLDCEEGLEQKSELCSTGQRP
eukprot:4201544-Lingulodinium_polyedra.AAC.1